MSKRIFCINCGNEVLYSLKLPKFCSHCGKPPAMISNAAQSTVKASSVIEVEENAESNLDDAIDSLSSKDFVIDDGLDINLNTFASQSFESLAKQAPESDSQVGPRRRGGGIKPGMDMIKQLDDECLKLQRKEFKG